MATHRVSILVLLATMSPPGVYAQLNVPTEFTSAAEVLELAISDAAFPGCSVAVGNSQKRLWSHGFGHFVYEDFVAAQLGFRRNPRVTTATIYDLASLTKVVGTTSVVMCLVRDGKLRPRDKVATLIPAFADASDPRRAAVTVEQLLIHSSGLPSWKAFYKDYSSTQDVIGAVLKTPLQSTPGEKYAYSDLGFMSLGQVCRQAGGRSLPELETKFVFTPLEMHNTFRQPSEEHHMRIPPTEKDPATGEFLHGIVHDENCRAARGVTGHAGLFSTAEDLSKLAAELLKGYRGDSKIFPQPLVEQFVARNGSVQGSSRALGWDTPSGRSSGGDRISANSAGHTGFTGTSMWIDFDRDVYFILLTNRVHPTRDNRKISNVRRQFADAVLLAFDKAR